MAGGSVELGTGYISIVPSAKGFQADLNNQIGKATAGASKAGASVGSRISSGMGKALKVGGVAAGALLATSLSTGFKRLTAIEDAEAKLKGLGNSAGATARIMDNALAAVKGTAFGMDEAATTAASAVAAGLKPGRELQSYLSLVGDAATIAGTSMADMGGIFNKVMTSGKVQGDVFAQLGDQGIPVVQMLSDTLGVSAEEVYKLGSAGKITSDQFLQAMSSMEGAALKGGDTTTGAFKNLGAAVSRLGAGLLSGMFPHFKTAFTQMTAWVDGLEETLTPLADTIGQKLGSALEAVVGVMSRLDFSSWSAFTESMGSSGSAFDSIKNSLVQLQPAFAAMMDALPAIGTAAVQLGSGALQVLAGVLSFLGRNVDTIIRFMPLLLTGWLAWTVASKALVASQVRLQIAQTAMAPVFLASNILRWQAVRGEVALATAKGTSTTATVTNTGAENANLITRGRAALAMVGQRIAMIATTVATTAASVATTALGVAMKFAMGPVGLIIMGIAALVAGLVWFFTKTETGKAVWDSLVQAFSTGWEWVKRAFAAAWAFIQPILQGLWTAVQFVGAVFATIIMGTVLIAWNLFAAVLSMVWNTIIKPVWDAFAAVMTWLWNVVVMPIWNAMKLGLNLLGAAFTFVWNSIIKPVWDALGAGIAFVWTTLIQPAWNAMKAALAAVGMAFQTAWNTVIKPVWNALGTGIRTVIDTVVMPAWDLMKRGLDTVKGHFDRAVDGIKSVWESLSAALRKPIDFLIDVVWNRGLVPAWNRVREFLPDLPEAVPMAGFATGGAVNGPGTGTSDSIMARLSTGEHVLTAAEVDALGGHNVIYAIRALIKRGTPFNWDQVQGLSQWPAASLKGLASGSKGNRGDAGLPGFAKGGEVRPAWHAQLENGHRAAKMRNGNPYTWGFEDCSGYMSMIADAILNGGDGVRKWATGSFPGGQPWVPGLGEGFSVGVHDNPGGPGGGHTSGTLSGVGPYSSVNVESGGSHGHVAYGGPAAGADSPQWVGVHPGQFHLGIGADGAFESGGGPSPEAQRSVIKEKIKEILDKALEPITGGMANAIGSPPPPYLDIPPQSLTATKDAAVDAAFAAVESVGSGLRTVYDSAKDVVTGITGGFTGLFRDQGGWIPNGLSMVRNETGRPEAVLNWDQIKQLQDLLDSLSVTARDSFLKSTKSGVADFFGVSGIVDTIEEVMKGSGGSGVSTDAATVSIDTAEVVIDSPAALPTTATDLPGATDFGYENKSVELDTKMPDLDTSAPGSGPVKDQVREAFAAHGWDKGAQWDAVEYIVGKESSWNPTIRNPSSGAFGLFQFLGGTKDTYLPDENPNPKIQGAAGAKYIKDRYGDPLAARAFWEQNGWYDQGGWLKTGVTLTRNDTGKPEAILNPSQWSAISRQTDLVSEIAQNGGGGPMVVIEHMEARNEAEAMRAASREARRLTRSTSLVGGWRS